MAHAPIPVINFGSQFLALGFQLWILDFLALALDFVFWDVLVPHTPHPLILVITFWFMRCILKILYSFENHSLLSFGAWQYTNISKNETLILWIIN
jgi:hypothetical protein